MNRGILGSILFGTQRERDKASIALTNLISGMILAVALTLAALIFLLPGIVINHARGRYKNDSHSLRTSIQDGQTWLISLPISFLALVILSVSGAFRTHQQVTDAPLQTATVNTSVESGQSRPEVRRATAVSSSPQSPVPVVPPLAAVRRAIPVAASSPASAPTAMPPDAVASPPQIFSVTGIAQGDTLNVRSGPGMNNVVTAKLSNGFTGIQLVGSPVMNDTTEWVQITFGGHSGWVRRQYVKPALP